MMNVLVPHNKMTLKMQRRAKCLHLDMAYIALTLLMGMSCKSKSQTPTEQVTAFIHKGVKALEENQLGDAVSLISDTYEDAYGRDKGKMKRMAFFVLRRGSVTLFVEKIQIRFQDNDALVDCELIGLQGLHQIKDIKDILPQHAKRFKLQLVVTQEGDQWKLRSMNGDGFHSTLD